LSNSDVAAQTKRLSVIVSDQPTIDKGVPLPPARFNEGHPFAVLRKLQVGDSVFFRGVIAGSNAYKVLSNRMSYLKTTQEFMLTARSVVENGDRGVRVWRRGA
jgi:hypothetical protein